MQMKVVCMVLVIAGFAAGQNTPPAFEVADVKSADPSNPVPAGKGRNLPGGRIELAGATLNQLIMFAYGVQENMIAGAPKWAGTQGFDIVAKAPPDTNQATLQLMLQSLIVERFRLKFHREERPMPAYVLTLGKRELKLKPGEGAAGEQSCRWLVVEEALRRRECHNISMAELARQLPVLGGAGIDRPVVDETGLKGGWDLQFELAGTRKGDLPDAGPDIFQALEQIGLRLESRKMTLPAMVIDHAESPGGN
jgi:uncharacterized protein (TIGR03435 family)